MKRVSETSSVLPVASGMDKHARRAFQLSLRQTQDALSFGAERLVRWLNGWESFQDQLRDWDVPSVDYPKFLAKYGGDPQKQVELIGWSEESHSRILALLGDVRGFPAKLSDMAAGKGFSSVLADPVTVYELTEIDAKLERYAVAPRLLFQPSTGRFAVGYRVPGAHYASYGHTFEEDENADALLAYLNEPLTSEQADRFAELLGHPLTPEEIREFEETGGILTDAGREAQKAELTKPPFGEIQAAHAVLDLARYNVLDRIKQCHCGTWFFAANRTRVSCKPTCRHKRYEQSENFREKRRVYARKLYQVKKGRTNFAKAKKKKASK